jgi:hypothetical protein
MAHAVVVSILVSILVPEQLFLGHFTAGRVLEIAIGGWVQAAAEIFGAEERHYYYIEVNAAHELR